MPLILFSGTTFLYIVMFFIGTVITSYGLVLNIYKKYPGEKTLQLGYPILFHWVRWLDRLTNILLLKYIKTMLRTAISFTLLEEDLLTLVVNVLLFILTGSGVFLFLLTQNIGQLWYVKVLTGLISFILPYYSAYLMLDIYKYRIDKQIPSFIDEFRAAFIKHRKVRPALKECSCHIDKSLSSVIYRIAETSDIDKSLVMLKQRFDNIWFNIWAVLLINFKENGGELVDQLYKLNRTMTRYLNIEKKKNRRLLWYEIFAVSAALISIPAVAWLNTAILGNSADMADPGANIVICRIIIFSIIALMVIRLIRKA